MKIRSGSKEEKGERREEISSRFHVKRVRENTYAG